MASEVGQGERCSRQWSSRAIHRVGVRRISLAAAVWGTQQVMALGGWCRVCWSRALSSPTQISVCRKQTDGLGRDESCGNCGLMVVHDGELPWVVSVEGDGRWVAGPWDKRGWRCNSKFLSWGYP